MAAIATSSDGPADDPPLSATSDELLLARFNRGDRAALGQLASRYERPLLGLTLGIVGGRRDQALDAVQDTWVRVIRFAKGFKEGSTVKTWLYRVAINAAKDARSRASRMRLQTGEPSELADVSEPVSELGRTVRDTVNSLSEDRRLLVLLCYHQELTHVQVAEVLGVPAGTVKSRLHAALIELREKLGQEVAP